MTTILATIDQIRDDLAEARRWVRSDPEGTRARVGEVQAACAYLMSSLMPADYATAARLCENLNAGQRVSLAAPGVLEAYIDGALYELAALRGRVEREAAEATS